MRRCKGQGELYAPLPLRFSYKGYLRINIMKEYFNPSPESVLTIYSYSSHINLFKDLY